MSGIFYKIGKKIGQGLIKGQTYYKYLLGDDKEAAGAEYLIGSKIARKIISDNAINNQEKHTQFIEDIGQNLVSQLDKNYFDFNFYIIETSDQNGFAIPGGFVFITSGLYNQIRGHEDEIAFVFAHEIMHIMLKHPLKKIITNYSGKVLADLLSKNSSLGMVFNKLIKDLFISTYSRDKEYEADKKALQLMYRAGYQPDAAQKLLTRLSDENREGNITYFSSHPATDDRIARLERIREKIERTKLR